MRIVAGKYRSRILKSLRNLPLRPTSDKLRETLFNILGSAIEGSVFVDVYAGTGAVGIEALSRGAAEVVFVEKHEGAANLIRRNLESLGIHDSASILAVDALRGLEMLAHRRFGKPLLTDFVFLDPPYAFAQDYDRVLEFLDGSPLLAPAGLVIVEHRKGVELPGRLAQLECFRVVEQGDAALTFYRFARAA
ncbi:MAG TPA: 16S rRNA (guanine(966)-N(2))-methyltransferase RsmD [Candidatus Acidoferrales bacterium]|nr:16S rRNA (guanine(966)-N(2))-methyltransferase RsmD [Candidatus Acidoferrales bacterium]